MAAKSDASEAATDRILKDLGRTQITSDQPRLSDAEERVLELYEKIEDLRLQQAIIDAASSIPVGAKVNGEKLEQELKKAERDMLDARVLYLIRSHVIDDVLAIDPILKAVHADPLGDARERDLYQLVNQRDVLSLTHGNITEGTREVQRQLLTTQIESIKAVEENQKLAHDLRTIAAQLKRKEVDNLDDEDLKEELKRAQSDLERAKRRRQLIKGVISAVVAGSGVDWAQDERLLQLVLEEET